MNIATMWHDTVEPETPQDRIARLLKFKGLLQEIAVNVKEREERLKKDIEEECVLKESNDNEL
jgi:hypothetical protein